VAETVHEEDHDAWVLSFSDEFNTI
jgi:hypothetical protein